MKAQVNKIITELGLVRTETVYYDKTDKFLYLGTEHFILQLSLEDYESIDQKAKDRLSKVIGEKGKERVGVYHMAFEDLKNITYTKFLVRANGKSLAIYDKDGEYIYLDQAITIDIEPDKFKAYSKLAIVAGISKTSNFAAIAFIAEEVDEIIKESPYFKSEE